MSRPEWLKAGALCKTRDDRKATIVAVCQQMEYPAIGYIDGILDWKGWRSDGRMWTIQDSPIDLIGPWVEPIVMDWAALPKWATHIYALRPQNPRLEWKWSMRTADGLEVASGFIPPAYAPKWSGDYRESLTKVPREVTP